VLKSKSDDSQAFAKSYGDGLRYFAMLVFPACLGAAAITPALLPFLYGPSFAEAVVPAMILIAGCCAMPFIAITQQYAMAVERTGMVLWLTALGAALSILSGLTLTPLYGTDGAAIGRVVAQATVAAAMLVYARRLGWTIPYGVLWRLLAASSLCAGVAGMVIYGLSGGAGIAAAIVAAAIAYILLIGWLRILSEDDYLMLARLPVGAKAAALIGRWSRLWHSSAARQPPLPSGLRVKSQEDV
jgi:O-antigen/teichoic acid export membrane protein